MIVVSSVLLLAIPSTAQEAPPEPGSTATVDGSQVGQRKAPASAAPNIEPTARVNSRVQNRIQSRQRTRIDRYYEPPGTAKSPFEVAEDQVR